MKKIAFVVIVLSLFTLNVFAQKDVILKIDNQPIGLEEFERIYNKNNTQLSDENELKSPKEYMEMFINFKLKVIEAENRGMDTISSFIKELEGYRRDLAKPYLTDISFTDSMIHEAYYRSVHEVRASHILIRVDEKASKAEDQKAYDKIMEIRNRIVNGGEDFKTLAKELSEDPSAKSNSGDLGYFSAFQMVTPFENAAFDTPVGEVSMPVRTRFGYHLIYTEDLRKSKGEVKVAHIMKMFSNPRNVSEQEVAKLKVEIDSVYQKLLNGEDFAKLAKEYSMDVRTANNGGEMSWIKSSFNVPEFAQAAFALDTIGQISGVIKTDYGWHILKLVAKREPKTFNELRDDLTNRVKRDPERSKYSRQKFVAKLKDEYGFAYNTDNKAILDSIVNDSKIDSLSNSISPEIDNLELFTVNQKQYTIQDFLNYVFGKKLKTDKLPRYKFTNEYSNFEDQAIVDYEDSQLEEKYPDFKYLMKEYHDGILLFSIMEEEVWNKAMQDTLGLEAFYAENQGKYKFGKHFDGYLINCDSIDIRDKVTEMLKAGTTDPEVIENELNSEDVHSVNVKKAKWEKGDNATVDFYVFDGEKPEKLNEDLTFVYGDVKDEAVKTLDEARGLYISDYQDYLEKQWLETLHNKYKIKVNKKLLKKVKQL